MLELYFIQAVRLYAHWALLHKGVMIFLYEDKDASPWRWMTALQMLDKMQWVCSLLSICLSKRTRKLMDLHTKLAKYLSFMQIFDDWIQKVNKTMKTDKRKILLLMDNAASHALEQDSCMIHGLKAQKLSNVTLVSLPANTTSVVQPLDAGIIAAYKKLYKTELLRWYLQQIEADRTADLSNIAPDLKQAISWTAAILNQMKPETIVNCWKKVKILPPALTQAMAEESDNIATADDQSNAEIGCLIQALELGANAMSADEYLQLDHDSQVWLATSHTLFISHLLQNSISKAYISGSFWQLYLCSSTRSAIECCPVNLCKLCYHLFTLLLYLSFLVSLQCLCLFTVQIEVEMTDAEIIAFSKSDKRDDSAAVETVDSDDEFIETREWVSDEKGREALAAAADYVSQFSNSADSQLKMQQICSFVAKSKTSNMLKQKQSSKRDVLSSKRARVDWKMRLLRPLACFLMTFHLLWTDVYFSEDVWTDTTWCL